MRPHSGGDVVEVIQQSGTSARTRTRPAATCSSTSRSRFGQSSARTSVIAPTPHCSTRPRLIVAVGSRPPHRGLADLVRAPDQRRGPTRGRPLRILHPTTGRPSRPPSQPTIHTSTCNDPALPNPLCPSRSRLPPRPATVRSSSNHPAKRPAVPAPSPNTTHPSCPKATAAHATRTGTHGYIRYP
jgi:hypothetical protein